MPSYAEALYEFRCVCVHVFVICMGAHKHVQVYSPGQVHVEVRGLDHISPTIASLPYSLFLEQSFLLI